MALNRATRGVPVRWRRRNPLFAVSAGDRAVALWAHAVQVAPLTGTAGHLQLAATARAEPAAAGGSFLDDQTVATASASEAM
jgi:hypothetical protein